MNFTDPITGESQSKFERFSWFVQSNIIRRFWFLGLFSVVTVIAIGSRNMTVAFWWNVGASWLAIFVENIVGMAMFNQTRRDAKILREIRQLAQTLTELQQQDLEHQKNDYEVTVDVNQKLGEVVHLLTDEFDVPDPWWAEYNEE